jgi:hypothetical protein
MRRRYVMRAGVLVEWQPPAIPLARSDLPAPLVQGDLAPYRSLRTGETIDGRAQHREHLHRHELIEVGNERAVFAPRPMVEGAPGEIARDIKRQIERDPGERRAEATQVLRQQGYEGPQVERILGPDPA